MAATDSFRKQHAEMAEVVKRIEALLDPQKAAASANEVRGLLSTMMGKLTLHLAMEDNVLYPRLQNHQDSKVRETATRFMNEMAGMKPTVDAFGRKWTESEIRNNAAGFCAETKKLFAVLADRMKRENTQLYPMTDAVAANA